MNTIRGLMTVFLVTVLTAALLGWRWVGGLPPAKLEAARVVLTLAALATTGAIAILWSAKPQRMH